MRAAADSRISLQEGGLSSPSASLFWRARKGGHRKGGLLHKAASLTLAPSQGRKKEECDRACLPWGMAR